MFYFHPYLPGEMESNLTVRIFFKWVGEQPPTRKTWETSKKDSCFRLQHHKEVQLPIEVVLVVQHWEVQQYEESSIWIYH